MALRIFIEQYGFFWSFTPEQFLKMALIFIKTDKPFNYDDYGKRRARPPYKHICRYRSEGGNWFASSPGTILYSPLDWDRNDYIAAAREIRQKLLTKKGNKNAKK
jgi:hypothetical protein